MMAEVVTTVLRGYPAPDNKPSAQRPTRRARPSPRLGQRPAVIVHAIAETGTVPERFGLGAALVVLGPSVLSGCLFVADDVAETAPQRLTRVRRWAEEHPVATTTGPRPWHVATLSEFFDPFARVEREAARPWAFAPTAYEGGGFVVGADLGRFFGLVAEHVVVPRGRRAGAWQVWLPGWGKLGRAASVRRRSPHRPCLYLRPRRVGWQVSWGPCGTDKQGRPAGKRDRDGRPWTGLFIDVMSLAYALDADRGASFAEHCEDFGLVPSELPMAVTVTEQGAETVAGSVAAIHRLALRLDEEASSWFRSGAGRTSRVDLARTTSPGAIATELLERAGLTPPLAKFDLTQPELEHWAEASHGGWCEADPRFIGHATAVVSADISSAYPLVAHWLGWWEVLCAGRLRRQGVTAELRQLCKKAVVDPCVALEPEVWRRFGLTLVEVMADGERFPHAFEDPHHLDDRMEVVGVRSPERSLWYPWADVLAAAVLSGRVPKIVHASRLVPEPGPYGGPQHLRVLPRLTVETDRDPAPDFVRHRRAAKARGDQRLAAELRVVVNALVYGGFCRFDDVSVREGRRMVVGERPGPWAFVPISASVTAGARLLLAVADRLVADRGGAIVYRDTDSALIAASPEGGSLALPGGGSARALSWAEVDEVLSTFSQLSPEAGWEVWKLDRGEEAAPLQATVFGNKRHVEWSGDGFLLTGPGEEEDDAELVDATEANLGGTYADPPALAGRVGPVSGYRRWSMAAVRREVDYAKARMADLDALRPPAPWDQGQDLPAPALRQLMVKTPAMAKTLPAFLGPRPGTRYLEAQAANEGQRCIVPVARDPGGDLAGWQGLTWFDRRSGQRIQVATDPEDYDSVRLVTLDAKASDWSRPSRRAIVTEVVVDPRRVRVKGRVSPVLDAISDEGSRTDVARRRPAYRPITCGCGCGTPLPKGRPDKRFVTDAHRKRAARASQKVAL